MERRTKSAMAMCDEGSEKREEAKGPRKRLLVGKNDKRRGRQHLRCRNTAKVQIGVLDLLLLKEPAKATRGYVYMFLCRL